MPIGVPARIVFLGLATLAVSTSAFAQPGTLRKPSWAPPLSESSAAASPANAGGTPPKTGKYDLRMTLEWKTAADRLCAESKYSDAEKYYAKILEEREHAFGLNSPEIVADISDLGRVAFAQMKFGTAENYYSRALQILENAKGKNSLDIVPVLNQLAKVTRAATNYMGSEQFAQRALGIVERYRGAEHADNVPALINVARVQLLQQTPAKALPLLQRALAIQEKASGLMGLELAPVLDLLGEAARSEYPGDTEMYWKRSLAVRESNHGPAGLEVTETLDRLGQFYFEAKSLDKAAATLERALYIRSRLLGNEHPATQETSEQVAAVYASLGRTPDAQPLVKEIFSAREQTTAQDLTSLAKQADGENRLQEADSFYRASIAVLDKRGLVFAKYPALDPNDPPTAALIETVDNYVALLKKMNKKKDAKKLEYRANLLAARGPANQRK